MKILLSLLATFLFSTVCMAAPDPYLGSPLDTTLLTPGAATWTVSSMSQVSTQLWWQYKTAGCSSNRPPAEVSTFCVPCLSTPLVNMVAPGVFDITEREPTDAERAACVIPAGFTHIGGIIHTDIPHVPLIGRYGYFEATMRFGHQPGLWPAFWLWPYPANSLLHEVDVMEAEQGAGFYTINGKLWVGDSTDKPASTIHFGAYPPKGINVSGGRPVKIVPNSTNNYGVSVQPHLLLFYVNRKEVWRVVQDNPFPYFVIANTSVHGTNFNPTTNPSGVQSWNPSPNTDTSKYPAIVRIANIHFHEETTKAIASQQ